MFSQDIVMKNRYPSHANLQAWGGANTEWRGVDPANIYFVAEGQGGGPLTESGQTIMSWLSGKWPALPIWALVSVYGESTVIAKLTDWWFIPQNLHSRGYADVAKNFVFMGDLLQPSDGSNVVIF